MERDSAPVPVQRRFTQVSFEVTARTGFGEQVKVMGSSLRLGQFKYQKALPLVTTPETYPVWRCLQPVMLPTNVEVAYTYIVASGVMEDSESEQRQRVFRTFIPTGKTHLVRDNLDEEASDSSASDTSNADRHTDEGTTGDDASKQGDPSSIDDDQPKAQQRAQSKCEHSVTTGQNSSSRKVPPGLKVELGCSICQQQKGLDTTSSSSAFDDSSSAPRVLSGSTLFVVSKYLPVVVRRVRQDLSNAAPTSSKFRSDVVLGGTDALEQYGGYHSDNEEVAWEWKVEWNHSKLSRQHVHSLGTSVKETKWVGVIPPSRIFDEDGSLFDPDKLDGLVQLQITDAVTTQGCLPVWPDVKDWQNFEGYCRQFLSSVLHNVQELAGGESCMRWEARNDSVMWTAYKDMNRKFAHAVCAKFVPQDVVWVHDVAFMLAPRMIRALLRKTRRMIDPGIILYFDSPFPTSEIMRSLGRRDKILFGMLSSSLLVFNVNNYARHCVNTCQRTLGLKARSLEGGMLALETPDSRNLGISIVAPSPDVNHLEEVVASHNLIDVSRRLKAKYGNKKIIVGIDKCSRLSGVSLKLLAYEKLLGDCPRLVGKVVLVQRCIVTGSGIDAQRSSRENQQLVKRIAQRFGDKVIDYVEARSCRELHEQLKLWLIADVFLHTPVREKYSLEVLEFVWSIKYRQDSPPQIIISEFSGVTQSLNGVYEVNPFNVLVVASTIDKVLTASKAECRRRANRLLDAGALLSQASRQWGVQILRDLLVVWKGLERKVQPPNLDLQGRLQPNAPVASDLKEFSFGIEPLSQSPSSQLLSVPSSSSLLGHATEQEMVDLNAYTNSNSMDARHDNEMTTLESHTVVTDSGFRKASATDIKASYHQNSKRLFLLAYGGSLVAQEPTEKAIKHDFLGAEGREPKSAMKSTLTRLAADPANAVFIVSDMAEQQITSLLRGIPNLGFVVGNGLKVVWPSGVPVPKEYTAVDVPPVEHRSNKVENATTRRSRSSENSSQPLQWTTVSYDQLKSEWLDLRADIIKTMEPFRVVNGSRLITDNEVKVEWDFSRADPEWGGMQADCLCAILRQKFATHSNILQINRIQGRVVEVNLWVLGLRSFVRDMVMPSFRSGFVLATANTSSDEEMFLGLYEAVPAQTSSQNNADRECDLHMITMGKKASQASLYVDGSQGLLRLLSKLR